jgi:polyvinyl alcohol dehydrogenase (cytochrome)
LTGDAAGKRLRDRGAAVGRTRAGLAGLLLACAALAGQGQPAAATDAPPAATTTTTTTTTATAATAVAAPAAAWPVGGHDLDGSRSNPDEHTLGPGNVGGLYPKWAVSFTTPLAATPAVVDGAVYLADRAGTLRSYVAATGATRWIRTVSSYTGLSGDIGRATPAVAGNRVVFGDQPVATTAHDGTHLVAVDSATGSLLWKSTVDTQPTAKITGAPVIDGGTVYVGVSSSDENLSSCCHFRGSVVAVDLATGKLLWRTYTVPVGYTGGAVWGGSPVVDHTTGLLYVGTGNNYTVPPGVCTSPGQTGCTAPAANDYVDALLALRLTTGAPVWALRTLSADVWTRACSSMTTCGPDFDFGSAPNLFTTTIAGKARRLVGIGQKSGIYWAADAATGALVWQRRVGPGGLLGGIQWGSATDGTRLYVAVTNWQRETYTLSSGATTTGGAWSALDPATGAILWQTADPQGMPDFGFVSAANGVVFAGSAAGTGATAYALDAATGAVRWSWATGGSVMGGAAIVDGRVHWATGYYTKVCPSSQPGCGTTYKLYAFGLPASAKLPPGQPTAVTATRDDTAHTAVLRWSPPTTTGGSAVTGYRVSRDGVDSAGSGPSSTVLPATARSQTFTRLAPGRTYALTVQALNAVGAGEKATVLVTMAPAP